MNIHVSHKRFSNKASGWLTQHPDNQNHIRFLLTNTDFDIAIA